MSSEHSKAANRMQRRFNPYFKKWGFSSNGRVYSKIFDDGLTALATIELEGTHLAGQFNIEMSIFIPEVHDFLSKFPVRGKLRNVNCCIRCRFSDYRNGYNTKWWPISSDAKFVTSFMNDFETNGLAFLEGLSSREKILERYSNENDGYGRPPKIVAAMIYLGKGDRVSAARLLFEQAAQTEHVGHRDSVLELAHKYQLLPKLTLNDFNSTIV